MSSTTTPTTPVSTSDVPEIPVAPDALEHKRAPGVRGTTPALLTLCFLFSFLVSGLMLVAPAEFYSSPPGGMGISDGAVAYRVAQRLFDNGQMDLLEDDPENLGKRIVRGVGDRSYAIFGVGYPIYLTGAVALDRAYLSVTGLGDRHELRLVPLFFAATANAWTTAVAGVLLVLLLMELGQSLLSGLFACMVYVFTSMALPYARLSFDMPLGVALLFAMAWLLVRGAARHRRRLWMFAGATLGAAAMVRLPSAIFGLPAVLYVWQCRPSRSQADAWRDWMRDCACFGFGIAPFAIAIALANWIRFGGPFDTGYTDNVSAFAFDAAPWITIPALLFSPARGLFTYSPLLVFALPGLTRLWRERRDVAWLLAFMFALNLCFYAANRGWATPNGWGPRFQLLCVLLLSVPVAYGVRSMLVERGRAVRLALFGSVVVGFLWQLMLSLVPHAMGPFRADLMWNLERSQITAAMQSIITLWQSQELDRLQLWWLGPGSNLPGMSVLFWILLAVCLASALGLAISRRPVHTA